MKPYSFECEVGGRALIIETGKLAGQASGAVTVRYGDTVALVTVCVRGVLSNGLDLLRLGVGDEARC